MDPEFMKEVDERYGPLEWRLPEAHAIYWAALGLKKAAENPTKIKADDLITLRRVIYQSMQLSFQRGRLVTNPFAKAFEFGPNLDIIPKVNFAYEQAAQEDEKNRDHILEGAPEFPARRGLFPLRVQSPGRRGAMVQIPVNQVSRQAADRRQHQFLAGHPDARPVCRGARAGGR